MMRSLRSFVVLLAFLATALAARDAAAVHYKICFKLAVAPQDAGVGEDLVTAPTPELIARGVKVFIEDGDTGIDLFGNLNNGEYVRMTDGCVEYDTLQTGAIDVVMYAETQIDFSELIQISAWDHNTQYDAWVNGGQQDNDLESWAFLDKPVTTCAAGKCATIVNMTETDPVANMLAFATFQVHRTENLCDTKLAVSGSPRLHLINDECPTSGTGSCQAGDKVFIQSPAVAESSSWVTRSVIGCTTTGTPQPGPRRDQLCRGFRERQLSL